MADSKTPRQHSALARLMRRLRGLRRERRERAAIAGSALFDPAWYLEANADVGASGTDPLTHYVRVGASEGRRPSPWFDPVWYLARSPDIASTGQNPLAHYVRFGSAEGRDPNPLFSSRWYRVNNPDAAQAPTLLDHYVRVGAAGLRDPSVHFDIAWYVERNPDVADSGLDPLAHYLLIGRKEGRSTSPYGGAVAAGRPVTEARLEIFKALEPVDGQTLALFVAHAPDGRLKPNAAPYIEALAEAGVKVVLIVAADRPFAVDPVLKARLAGGFVRDNVGYDFAAWAHVMRAEPGLFAAETLLLANDSLIGPSSPAALSAVLERVRTSPADVVGATDNRQRGWHLQSFFIAFKRRALSSLALQAFFGAVRSLDDKNQVIGAYEVPLAEAMQAAGLDCEALFPGPDAANPTVAHWRALIEAGFPFVKTLTLRDDSRGSGASEWRETLAHAGFDLAVADATRAAVGGQAPPPPRAWPLLRDPADAAPTAQPWKVAFIGPWTYASGLGEASRGYLQALWRTGVRLNLRSVARPIHVHQRLLSPISVDEFEGPADVAVIHMNPDSWHLLGEAEQEIIARARRRAGLWVWEMGHLPANWRPNFDKVDAAWAPSRYCAELFAEAGAAQTGVVPHVVATGPPVDAAGRAAILARLGAPAGARLVLYAFDGSSYLVRKNPQALVRAFAASRLAAEGWRLVLKTKRLMERPEEGGALRTLAEATPGVILVDQSLSRDEMAALFAAADIYASPHRSEGFGLTIAEAMALGKSVVASDFGGSRDILDPSCGYPVSTRAVPLDRDFGHYTRGGVWGEVDEAAFAEALRAAADGLSAGEPEVGRRARERIAERLSADAVAGALQAALAAVIAAPSNAEAA